MIQKLTKTDQKRLARCEQVIRDGLATFVAVGQALADIRREQLYMASHETFEGYCADRWEIGRSRAYQLIAAAETTAAVSTIVDILPEREAHVRPLQNVPADHRAEVWQTVVDGADRDGDGRPVITAASVERAVNEWHERRKVDSEQQTTEGGDAADEADVIDVESRPVGDGPQGKEGSWTCPHCGEQELGHDEDGAYCAKCKEPVGAEAGRQAESERDEDEVSEEDEFIGYVDQVGRELFEGRLAVGAARLEAVIELWRSKL